MKVLAILAGAVVLSFTSALALIVAAARAADAVEQQMWGEECGSS